MRRSHHLLLRRRRRPFLLLLLLLTFVLLLLFLSRSPATTAVAAACRATRFPTTCLSTLSSSSSPSSFLLTSLSAAASSLPTPTTPLCSAHLSLSRRRLAAASAAISDHSLLLARHLAAAALHYQYDCSNSLSHVPSSPATASAIAAVSSSSALTSNGLALITASLLSRWAPPLTEREGFFDFSGGGGGFFDFSAAVAFPVSLEPNTTVCTTGTCDHSALQGAIMAAPDFASGRYVIHVAAGIYRENVVVPFEKTNLVLVGDGIGATVVTASLHAQMPGLTTYDTATFAVLGDGFRARGITFENNAGAGAHQAVAFRSDSDRSVLEDVEFRGHQDTLYARSLRQLYRRCRIAGTVDFIFGNAAAVFEDCTIESVPRLEKPEKGARNVVAAHARIDPAQPTGFVFQNCKVTGSAEFLELYREKPQAHRLYLGRPWKEYARAVYIGCHLAEVVRPEGWLPWRGEFALKTLFYGEFGSHGPGANDTARVGWSSRISEEHIGAYSVENFIQGHEWIAF